MDVVHLFQSFTSTTIRYNQINTVVLLRRLLQHTCPTVLSRSVQTMRQLPARIYQFCVVVFLAHVSGRAM